MRTTGTTVRYLLSDALSLMGNAVASVVLPLVLLARTGDVLATGTLALVCSVPQFVCGVAGGALLDRVNRRHVSIASDVVSALSVALLPVVDATWGLSFGWFVALGLLGAVGDVPGMSARDALLPEVAERGSLDLQRLVGASQSLGAVVGIAGPAAAALLMGLVGDVGALWATAALSCAAAGVTATLPREVGAVERAGRAERPHAEGASMRASVLAGLRTLFGTDALLRAATLLAFGITMVMGSFQGIVLPAHFSRAGHPELVGTVVAALGAGLLVGSLAYTALAHRASRRTWLVLSLLGMAGGVVVLGTLPALPRLLVAAAATGLCAAPASALLGFVEFDRVPDACRGSAMGTLNALYLVIAPVGAFLGSVAVTVAGTSGAGVALAVAWLAVTAAALIARPLRRLD